MNLEPKAAKALIDARKAYITAIHHRHVATTRDSMLQADVDIINAENEIFFYISKIVPPPKFGARGNASVVKRGKMLPQSVISSLQKIRHIKDESECIRVCKQYIDELVELGEDKDEAIQYVLPYACVDRDTLISSLY